MGSDTSLGKRSNSSAKNNKWSVLSLSVITLSLLSPIAYADIDGNVYRDLALNGSTLSTYGTLDSNEPGVAGVTVTAFDSAGNTAGTSTTDANGDWSIAGATGDLRVEFSNWPVYLQESPDVGGTNSSALFITASPNASNVNFGLHDVEDFTNTANPLYINNLQQAGSGVGNTAQALHTLRYNDTGLNSTQTNQNGVVGTGPVPQNVITQDEIGSAWGKAFQKDGQRLFVSSMLQRHIGFANTEADIYVVDYSSNDPSTEVLLGNFSLQGVNPANGGAAIDLGSVTRSGSADFTIPNSPDSPSVDLDAFAKVGKVSYGDIDFDQTSSTLWLVNLNQKGIISVDASGDFNSLSGATTNQYLIDSLANVPSCTGGSLRPWALKIHQGKGYLGATCDALTSQNASDLQAYVLSFDVNDPALGFTQELSFHPENSPNNNRGSHPWNAWSDANQSATTSGRLFYPQPILSDIEFDENNNMIVAFADRTGFQLGVGNYQPISGTTNQYESAQAIGDIFRVCDTSGTFEIEGTGSCTAANYGVEFFNDVAGDNASEGSEGSLAILKGTNEIMLSLVDPHPEGDLGRPYWTTQGTNTFSTVDGSATNWYTNIRSGSAGYNAKANSMGDVEILTAPAPIEIGNRVWLDSDADGVQDAGEAGISGVTVQLVKAGAVIATATTDASGNYIFSNDPTGTNTASHVYNIATLNSNESYIVRIPDAQGGSKQGALGSNVLTVANTGEGSNTDINDSDGAITGDDAEASVSASDIPFSGANNHTFDFGFTAPVSIGSYVWEDVNGDGFQTTGEAVVTSGIVTLVDENGVQVTTDLSGNTINPIDLSTNADGKFFFDNLAPGKYKIRVTPPAGYVPTPTQTGADDDNTENDSNINVGAAGVPAGTYESGEFTLTPGSEPTEGSGVGDDQDNAAIAAENSGNMTVDFGFIQPASLGDTVWYDTDRDGVQDTGETGVSGVTVTLFKDGVTTGQTDVTDGSGQYGFTGLEPGNYNVVFDLATLPPGYVVSPQDQGGDDAADSDANTGTGATVPTTLVSGENDPTWDMGINQPLASIGDTVWYDTDRDGVQDTGETGVAGVTVTLLKDGVSTGQTDVTDGTGQYGFTGLEPGNYNVVFDLATLPAGYVVSPQDAGTDNAVDSDANTSTGATVQTTLDPGENDPTWDMGINQPQASIGDTVWYDTDRDGVQDAGETGVAGVTVTLFKDGATTGQTDVTDGSGLYGFTDLEPGNYNVVFDLATLPAGYVVSPQDAGTDNAVDSDANISTGATVQTTLDPGENDPSWDMGISQPVTAIGDTVWYDTDRDGVQDTGETGVTGVTVTLFKDGISTGQTDVTDGSGQYGFTDLEPGDYNVVFDLNTLPAGYVVSPQDQGGDDLADSDVDTSTGATVQTTLDPGENDLSWDMGINQPPVAMVQIGDLVWIEDDNDGNPGTGTITFPPVGTIVTATASDGTTTYTGTTDVNGNYLIDVPQNDTYVVTVGTPTGTVATLGSDDNSVPDTTSENNSSHDGAGTTVVVTTEDNLTLDFGFVPSVKIGSLIWYEDDNDGDATTGTVTYPPAGVVVTARAADGSTYTGVTGENGSYSIDVPVNGSYTVTIPPPAGFSPTAGSDDNGVPGDNSEDNLTHNGSGTTVTVGTEDNLTVDFGFINNSLLPPPSNEPIPTLSEWALMLLMMMLGFVGYRESLARTKRF